MVHKDDGNLYFLNRYMNEQELAEDEYEDEQSGKEEFSGEELYELAGESGYKETANIFLEQALKYPNAGFEEAAQIAIRKEEKKKSLDDLQYDIQVSKNFYKNLKHWFDTKWLALDGNEEDILERIAEFLADIVYDTPVVLPEDFVETVVTANELVDRVYKLNDEAKQVAFQILRFNRMGVLKEGLLDAGITIDYVCNHTPTAVANKILSNTKYEGRNQPRLQVDNELFVGGLKTLGLPETVGDGFGREDEAGHIYANVIKAFRSPTNSKAFQEVIGRVSKELNNRVENGEDVKFSSKFYKDAGLLIISSQKAFLIIDTYVTLHQRVNPDKPSVVFRKSVYDTRVKDIKGLVSKL